MIPKFSLAIVTAVFLVGCGSNPSIQEIEELSREYTRNQASGAEWLSLARRAEDLQLWPQAAYALDQYLHAPHLKEDPITADWLTTRIRVAKAMHEQETAVRWQKELLKARPYDPDLGIALAKDLQSLGRLDEGVAILTEQLHDPNNRPQIFYALAQLYEVNGSYLAAAETLERLTAEDLSYSPVPIPPGSVLLQNASRLRELGGDLAGALKTLEAALSGMTLGKGEQRTLEHLKAFENGEPQTIPDALALMTQHPDADRRLAGADFLSFQTFPEDALAFARVLGDPDPRVARMAVREVAARGDTNFAPTLALLLRHPDEEVRLESIRGLSEIGTRAQIPSLLEAMDASDRALFRAVRQTLESISDHAIGDALDPSEPERVRLAQAWQDWWAKEQQIGAETGSSE